MKKELDWLDKEISEIMKEKRIKCPENKILFKFLIFLLPFSLLAFSLSSFVCPYCELPISLRVEKEVQWRCIKCQYYNSDSSGGDWAGDYYCGKCGEKK